MTSSDHYHHGDLPNTLRRAAAEVIDERGLGGFSLREVARRAGVSHNAPAHHFGDVTGLLTSLAQEGFETLCDATQTAVAGVDDPVERMMLIGEAYVNVAKSHSAQFAVMFRMDVIDPEDPDMTKAGLEAYSHLEATVAAVIDREGLSIDVHEASWLCWSAMQGLVVLEPKIGRLNEIAGGDAVSTRDLVRRFSQLILDGLRGTEHP